MVDVCRRFGARSQSPPPSPLTEIAPGIVLRNIGYAPTCREDATTWILRAPQLARASGGDDGDGGCGDSDDRAAAAVAAPAEAFDVVIGADVVYAAAAVAPLARFVRAIAAATAAARRAPLRLIFAFGDMAQRELLNEFTTRLAEPSPAALPPRSPSPVPHAEECPCELRPVAAPLIGALPPGVVLYSGTCACA